MAKAKEQSITTVTPTSNAVIGQLSDDFLAHMRETEGEGNSQAAQDNIVPMIYVLQPLSPQVQSRNPAYIEGAEPGMIWLRSAPVPLISGEGGILFQPCHQYKEFVEWIPRDRGGGFVGRFDAIDRDGADVPACEDAICDRDSETRQPVWTRERTGNDLVLTRAVAGLVYLHGMAPLPYVIPFTGTGHQVAREWQYRRNTKMVRGVRPAMRYFIYRLKTQYAKNKKGEWFKFAVSDATAEDGYPAIIAPDTGALIAPAGFINDPEKIEAGEALYQAFKTKTLTTEAPIGHGDDSEAGAGTIHRMDEIRSQL